MSEHEHHVGGLKKVDLSKFDNSREKYFETRYRLEFEANENRPNGLTEEEIQKAYQQSVEDKYRRRDAWENLWFCDTNDYDGVIINGNDVWEVTDIQLDDNEDIFVKVSEDECVYYTSFYNGGCGLGEALEYGLEKALKRDKS